MVMAIADRRKRTARDAERSSVPDLRIVRKTVQQQAVETLRAAILAGVFKPGERLIEAETCARLGISRPSLREALRSLAAERLIVIVPNRGPHVPVMSWAEAEQIYNVRALLEGEAVALCAVQAEPQHLRAMRNALQGFAAAVEADDALERVASTTDFYRAVLEAGGNAVIDEILTGLLARINLLRSRSMSRGARAHHSLREMTAIFEAIERGDEAAARAAAVHHVEQAAIAAAEAYEETGWGKA